MYLCGISKPNLAFVLNTNRFKPFKHIEYSVGVLYLVIANLLRSDRHRIENIIIAGIIPGPNEPQKTMTLTLLSLSCLSCGKEHTLQLQVSLFPFVVLLYVYHVTFFSHRRLVKKTKKMKVLLIPC